VQTLPADERLIVALDMDGQDALALARELAGVVRWMKIGMTLFYQEGPSIVARVSELGFRVFLDLKLHDIPHQVEGAAHSVAGLGVQMLTVHAAGGAPMIEAAVRGAERGAAEAGVEVPAVVAVTVLTSMSDAALHAVGVDRPAHEQVPLLGRVARAGGAAGVVCSPHEAAAMRELFGEKAYVVTPGVRPAGSETGDQSRVATPAAALSAGASHLVVGRPISAAPAPIDAAKTIITEMEGADSWPNS